MDNIDRKLLDITQDGFPLVGEPYREIAASLGTSAEDVILRLKRLREARIIRRMGAIFDSKKLGYYSTLCAMKVPDQRIDEVARIINEYTGVTHNYLRDHEYNVWFTIIARSRPELNRIMAEIQEKSGIHNLIDLPATRMFKIRVRFSMVAEDSGLKTQNSRHKTQDTGLKAQDSGQAEAASYPDTGVSEIEKHIVRELQGDMPLLQRPFKSIADKIGIEEEELLAKIRELKDRGVIRRLSAILRHRNLGISANAMGAWRVPEDMAEEVGTKMAAFSQISHCYQRPTCPGWPYSLFTMIHGRTAKDCEQIAESISQDTGIKDYRLLYSTRELKKVSMRYFTEKDSNNEGTF